MVFFFYLGFLSRTFTNHRTAREGRGHFFNSSLPFPYASQTLRHQPGDYCRELTSAHSQQPDSNREPLVSGRKSLTTKLRALKLLGTQAVKKRNLIVIIKQLDFFQICSCYGTFVLPIFIDLRIFTPKLCLAQRNVVLKT